jgi:hypothetical protein
MLDLNILGRYLRGARNARTTFSGKTTTPFRGRPTSALGKLVREVKASRSAADGDGERASAKSRSAAPELREEAAVQRRCRGTSEFEDHRHRSRRSARRTIAARIEAKAGGDRIQRVSEGQTANYLRRLSAKGGVGAAGRRRRR